MLSVITVRACESGEDCEGRPPETAVIEVIFMIFFGVSSRAEMLENGVKTAQYLFKIVD